jgi:DNA-binding beta-propeller fold protein YncE
MGNDINIAGIPEAITVSADGTVYVSDYSLGRLQIFDNDGNFLWALGGKSITKSLFKRPTSIAFDANGRMFVVNQSGNNVSVYQLP